jgi:GntR family transcriptional repressor for pyruvate dehydrogenase complex
MEKTNSVDFKKVKRGRLYEDVVNQIKQRIGSGELKVGDRLPTESEIMEKLGVSRVSLREGFRVLESEGLILCRPGEGRFVRATQPEVLFRTDGIVGSLEFSQIFDLLEARETVECKTAALAASRARPEEIKELRETVSAMVPVGQEGPGGTNLFALDGSFHRILAKASHNAVLLNWLNLSLEVLQETRKRALAMEHRRRALVQELSEIIEAVEKGDAPKAASAMKKHLRGVRKGIRDLKRSGPVREAKEPAFDGGVTNLK